MQDLWYQTLYDLKNCAIWYIKTNFFLVGYLHWLGLRREMWTNRSSKIRTVS
jgi:hypothetical protein